MRRACPRIKINRFVVVDVSVNKPFLTFPAWKPSMTSVLPPTYSPAINSCGTIRLPTRFPSAVRVFTPRLSSWYSTESISTLL